jgi:hypothetical protein
MLRTAISRRSALSGASAMRFLNTDSALQAFAASSERALMYSKLHANVHCTADLAAAAKNLAFVEAGNVADASVGLFRRHLLGSIASCLHRLGEAEVAQVYASEAASARHPQKRSVAMSPAAALSHLSAPSPAKPTAPRRSMRSGLSDVTITLNRLD